MQQWWILDSGADALHMGSGASWCSGSSTGMWCVLGRGASWCSGASCGIVWITCSGYIVSMHGAIMVAY